MEKPATDENYIRFGAHLLRLDGTDNEDDENGLTVGEAKLLNLERIKIEEMKKVWISHGKLEKFWRSGLNLDVFKGCFVSQKIPIHVKQKQVRVEKLRIATNVKLKRIAEIKEIRDIHGEIDPTKRSRNLADCRLLLKVHNEIIEIGIDDVSKSVFKAKEFENFQMHCAYYTNTKWPTRNFIQVKVQQIKQLDLKSKELQQTLITKQKKMDYQHISPNKGLKRKYSSLCMPMNYEPS